MMRNPAGVQGIRGAFVIAKDIMCRLKRYLQTIKIQLSSDILYSHDNEELIENDNGLIVCEL